VASGMFGGSLIGLIRERANSHLGREPRSKKVPTSCRCCSPAHH